METGHTEVSIRIKQSRTDTESIQKLKSIDMSIPLPMFDIPATSKDVFNSNQACRAASGPCSCETTDTCFDICEKKNMQDSMKLNVSCILTDLYDENQAQNMFYRTLYQISFSSLREKDVINKVSRCKLWV